MRLASMTSATTPLATAAAMLVPLSLMYGAISVCSCELPYRVVVGSLMAISAWPGATTSGLTCEVYHVGPRELKSDTSSSERVAVALVRRAPTVSADGALPGEVMPA